MPPFINALNGSIAEKIYILSSEPALIVLILYHGAKFREISPKKRSTPMINSINNTVISNAIFLLFLFLTIKTTSAIITIKKIKK